MTERARSQLPAAETGFLRSSRGDTSGQINVHSCESRECRTTSQPNREISATMVQPKPVHRISQQGGPKTKRGTTFLKRHIGCMQQPVNQTWNGGAQNLNGGPGITGPPAGDGPGSDTWPEWPRIDWRGKSCWLHPRPSGAGCTHGKAAQWSSKEQVEWLHLRPWFEPAELSENVVDREVYGVLVELLSSWPSPEEKREWRCVHVWRCEFFFGSK